MGRKRTMEPVEAQKKRAICVRMDVDLYDLIEQDSTEGERSPPAQVRLILKQFYGLLED